MVKRKRAITASSGHLSVMPLKYDCSNMIAADLAGLELWPQKCYQSSRC